MEKLRRERRANFGFCILIGRTNKKWAAALCPAAAGDKGGPVFNAVVDVDPYAAAYCLADNCAGCSENAGPSSVKTPNRSLPVLSLFPSLFPILLNFLQYLIDNYCLENYHN